MSEQPEIQVTFVKLAKDGAVEKTHQFEPWPTDPPREPGLRPRIMLGFVVPDDGERRPLRHLTYDDPPGIDSSPEQYRAMLAATAQQAGSLERFVECVTQVLVQDLVVAHGCHPEDAIPAVMEFAAKVYAEFSDTE